MPNRGGLIETDSVRHFFDIMEIDLFFLYGSFCKMQCCASPAQSARKVGITDKTAVLEIARKTSLKTGLCQMVLMTSKTSLQKWSGVFLFPSVSPVFFQIGTVTYQHRLRFRWRGFMYEFLPLIRKARTRCDLCRALHDFARLRLTSQCLPAGNYGWRKCIQRGCLKNTSSVSF